MKNDIKFKYLFDDDLLKALDIFRYLLNAQEISNRGF